MATNDGYTPYPLGLTAVEVKTAIDRAFNLTAELGLYVGFTGSTTVPNLLSGIKDGDVWHNVSTGVRYQAYVDTVGTPALLFFEV